MEYLANIDVDALVLHIGRRAREPLEDLNINEHGEME
jgi:hypothetical protein